MRFTCTRCDGKGTIGEEQLQRVQANVLKAVRAAKDGIAIDDLAAKVYSDDVAGGPTQARNSVQVTIKVLSSRLVEGKIIVDGKGRGARYRLVEGGDNADADRRDVHRRTARRHRHGGNAGREEE